MLEELVSKLCWWVVEKFPGRYRIIGVDGVKYLGRFYLKHNGILPGIYLHHFYRSDADRDPHNHPWKWACSFILTGGYYEERFEDVGPGLHAINTYERRAPCINVLSGNTFHRVVLKDLRRGAWTIFVSGPEEKDWGFKSRTTGMYVAHKEHLGLTENFVDKAPNRIDA